MKISGLGIRGRSANLRRAAAPAGSQFGILTCFASISRASESSSFARESVNLPAVEIARSLRVRGRPGVSPESALRPFGSRVPGPSGRLPLSLTPPISSASESSGCVRVSANLPQLEIARSQRVLVRPGALGLRGFPARVRCLPTLRSASTHAISPAPGSEGVVRVYVDLPRVEIALSRRDFQGWRPNRLAPISGLSQLKGLFPWFEKVWAS